MRLLAPEQCSTSKSLIKRIESCFIAHLAVEEVGRVSRCAGRRPFGHRSRKLRFDFDPMILPPRPTAAALLQSREGSLLGEALQMPF